MSTAPSAASGSGSGPAYSALTSDDNGAEAAGPAAGERAAAGVGRDDAVGSAEPVQAGAEGRAPPDGVPREIEERPTAGDQVEETDTLLGGEPDAERPGPPRSDELSSTATDEQNAPAEEKPDPAAPHCSSFLELRVFAGTSQKYSTRQIETVFDQIVAVQSDGQDLRDLLTKDSIEAALEVLVAEGQGDPTPYKMGRKNRNVRFFNMTDEEMVLQSMDPLADLEGRPLGRPIVSSPFDERLWLGARNRTDYPSYPSKAEQAALQTVYTVTVGDAAETHFVGGESSQMILVFKHLHPELEQTAEQMPRAEAQGSDELERYWTAPEQLEPEPDSQLDSEELERFSTAAEQPSYSTVPIVSAVWCCCR
jgi:hypothetical protein